VLAPAPIRVLHLTPRLTRAAGGAWHYVEGLVRSLEGAGMLSIVAGVVDVGSEDWKSLVATQVITGPPSLLSANYGVSAELRRKLATELDRVDIVHAHGFRVGTDLLAMRVVRKFGAKLLLSPHGQLHPAIAQRGAMKKALINTLWAKRYLQSIDAALAVGETEAGVIRAATRGKPIATLPIGVDAALYSSDNKPGTLATIAPAARGKRVLLYLAHMFPNKGVDRLADAWLRVHRERPDWHLVIAGSDGFGLGAAAAIRMRAAGAGGSFTLLGPLFDQQKRDLFADADLFTMPSDAESFGIAFAESLASGVPVIATKGAPWSSVVEKNCGWWIEPTVDALAATIREATALSDEDRRAMGLRGRELVRERFDWPAIAVKMRGLYESLLHHGDTETRRNWS
jgi:glycosyltransferase involved in cell wall biosynthesis